jgi:hypothetical protein
MQEATGIELQVACSNVVYSIARRRKFVHTRWFASFLEEMRLAMGYIHESVLCRRREGNI